VERISDLVGFQTPVSLRQHFRKRFQVSPRDWRRTFGQGEVGSA
jgi:transcriptional regulator GlxA family with amidase domain